MSEGGYKVRNEAGIHFVISAVVKGLLDIVLL
jgi:hypothetical protein